MPVSDSVPPPHSVRRLWLTETIRLAEERWGPYEDGEIVRGLRHASGRRGLSEAIQERSLALAGREGLDRHAAHLRDNAWLTVLGAMLLAVITGCGAALAALGDGDTPVNLFVALTALLGLHLLSFVLWLVSLRWSPRTGALGRVVMRIATRVSRLPVLAAAGRIADAPRPPAAALLPRAWLGLLQRAGLLRATLGSFTHAWWLLALLSALITLIALLATRRYGFIWETTLLSADTFVNAIQALGWLPERLGFSMPGPDAIRASDGLQALGPAGQAMWSRWLLGCVVVYGVIPRLLALAACLLYGLRQRPHLALDMTLPGLAVLAQRLRPASERLGVRDAAPAGTDIPVAESALAGGNLDADISHLAPGFAGRLTEPRQRILVGIELGDDTPWPPLTLVPPCIDAGILDDRAQRTALLEQFARNRPARLLMVCEAAQTPDRGTIALMAELSRSANASRIWLAGGAESPRANHWRDRLAQAGIAPDQLCDTPAAAQDWLQAGADTDGDH